MPSLSLTPTISYTIKKLVLDLRLVGTINRASDGSAESVEKTKETLSNYLGYIKVPGCVYSELPDEWSHAVQYLYDISINKWIGYSEEEKIAVLDILEEYSSEAISIDGMATALKANCEAIHENKAQLQMLERELLDRLDAARIVYTRNGGANTLPGLMSLSFPGKSGEAILHRLDLMGISISTGSACDSKNAEISHVLKAIKLDEELALGTIRISLGKYNTQEEASHIADALIKVMKQ